MKLKPKILLIGLLSAFLLILQISTRSFAEETQMIAHLRAMPSISQSVPSENRSTISSQDRTPTVLGSEPSLIVNSGYAPREEVRLAHSSNYGDRYRVDVYGKRLKNDFVVVLHETVYSAQSAINFFQTPHTREADQASYHTLIKRDGTVVYVVPPEKRAFGAGNSVFVGPQGSEAVKTDPKLPPSVNNFAYHVSLETPGDGSNQGASHSGYTERQYQSLAWLIAKTSVPEGRITTHRSVDRSGSRRDPRSFSRERFVSLLRKYPRRVKVANANLPLFSNPTLAIAPSNPHEPNNKNPS
jgi:hypothetical protein